MKQSRMNNPIEQRKRYVDVTDSPGVTRARQLLNKMHDQREHVMQIRTTLASEHRNSNNNTNHDECRGEQYDVIDNNFDTNHQTAEKVKYYEAINLERRSKIGQLASRRPPPVSLSEAILSSSASSSGVSIDLGDSSVVSALTTDVYHDIHNYHNVETKKRSQHEMTSLKIKLETVRNEPFRKIASSKLNNDTVLDDGTATTYQSTLGSSDVIDHTNNDYSTPSANFNNPLVTINERQVNSTPPATEDMIDEFKSFLTECNRSKSSSVQIENSRQSGRSTRSKGNNQSENSSGKTKKIKSDNFFTSGERPPKSTRKVMSSQDKKNDDKFTRRKSSSRRRKEVLSHSKSFDDRVIQNVAWIDSKPAYVTISKSTESDNYLLYQSVSADDADYLLQSQRSSQSKLDTKLNDQEPTSGGSTASITTSESGSSGSIQENRSQSPPLSPSAEQSYSIAFAGTFESSSSSSKKQFVKASKKSNNNNNKFSMYDMDSPFPIISVTTPSLQRSNSERKLNTPEDRKAFIDSLYRSHSLLPEVTYFSTRNEISKKDQIQSTVVEDFGTGQTLDLFNISPNEIEINEDKLLLEERSWGISAELTGANIFRKKSNNPSLQEIADSKYDTETLSLSSESSCDYTTSSDTSGWNSTSSNTITLDDDSDGVVYRSKKVSSPESTHNNKAVEKKKKKTKSYVSTRQSNVTHSKRLQPYPVENEKMDEISWDFGFVKEALPKSPKKRVCFAPDDMLEQMTYLYPTSEDFMCFDEEEEKVETIEVKPLFVPENVSDQCCTASGGLYDLALSNGPVIMDISDQFDPVSVRRGKAKQISVRWSTDFRCGTYGSLYDIACRSGCEVVATNKTVAQKRPTKKNPIKKNTTKKNVTSEKKSMITRGGSYDIALRSGLTKKALTSRDSCHVEINLKSYSSHHMMSGDEIEVLSEIISDRQCGANGSLAIFCAM